MQHKTPYQHGGDSAIERLTEQHFHSRIPPTEMKWELPEWCVVCSKYNYTKL